MHQVKISKKRVKIYKETSQKLNENIQDHQALCQDAVDFFKRGNFSRFDRTVEKLELIKTANVRSLLNQEERMLELAINKDQAFNERFRNEMSGAFDAGMDIDEEENQDKEEELANKIFKSQLSSGNLDAEMHKEMLLQKRNLMMRIRQNDSEFKKYDFKNEGYDGQLIQKKMKKGEDQRFEKREEKRQNFQAKKNQRMLQKCLQCFYSDQKFERDLIISESESCYVSFPVKTSPLIPEGNEPVSHITICPKQHFVNFVEVDEQVQNESRNFQKSITQYFEKELNMQAVFIETSIQTDNHIPHAQIDCIGVPNDIENEFDMELFFRKSFLEDDSEWGSHRKIIDTKDKQGMIWKSIPTGGVFNYVHIDFGGKGGFAHIIDDPKKYSETKALEVLGGAIGHELVNIKIPMRTEKSIKYVRDIKRKFEQFDWTQGHNQ